MKRKKKKRRKEEKKKWEGERDGVRLFGKTGGFLPRKCNKMMLAFSRSGTAWCSCTALAPYLAAQQASEQILALFRQIRVVDKLELLGLYTKQNKTGLSIYRTEKGRLTVWFMILPYVPTSDSA